LNVLEQQLVNHKNFQPTFQCTRPEIKSFVIRNLVYWNVHFIFGIDHQIVVSSKKTTNNNSLKVCLPKVVEKLAIKKNNCCRLNSQKLFSLH
jgi:hypothetical protein